MAAVQSTLLTFVYATCKENYQPLFLRSAIQIKLDVIMYYSNIINTANHSSTQHHYSYRHGNIVKYSAYQKYYIKCP